LAKGCRVFCADNLSTGSKKNISHLLGLKNFTFLRRDVSRKFNISIDEIYHLASPASPPHYQKDPVATFKANILGSLNLLELARTNKAKILLASTSEVYGDPAVHPQPESYWGNVNPVGVRSCYDESKRASETLFMDFHRQYGVNIKIVRIFNTYGSRMARDDGRVVSNFCVQALAGKPLTIYGSGKQTRSFQYIDDLVGGLFRLMASPANFTGPVNIGNPKEFTVLELANKIITLTGSKSKIIHQPLPQDDPRQRKPDISLAKKAFGWSPKINLEEGLKRTILFFTQKN
jgi:UDP-glucuronate decarboxylase